MSLEATLKRLASDLTRSATENDVKSCLALLCTAELLDYRPDNKLMATLTSCKSAEVRARAIWQIGVYGNKDTSQFLAKALTDQDALVRRRACEALIRAGVEPDVDDIWRLLRDEDRFVRTAARLVLQRIDPAKWTDKLWEEKNLGAFMEGVVALCKVDKAAPYAEQIFDRLHQGAPKDDVEYMLDYLRTLQLALIHTKDRPGNVRGTALELLDLFPHSDGRVNRELAILLTWFRMNKILDEPVHAKLLAALEASKADRQQQIHYFYCLRLLHEGWTP